VLVPADVAALGRMPVLVPHASLVAPACPEILPQHVVSYVGQPVALVVAESAAGAADALEALHVDYEPLPAVASLDDALRPDGPRVHPGGNVAARFTPRVGDPAAALAGADVVVRERFRLHRGAGMAMETRAITARWDADLGQLTVWSTTQAPQILRRILARFLGLATARTSWCRTWPARSAARCASSSRAASTCWRSPRSATSGTRPSWDSRGTAASWRCATPSCTTAAPLCRGA
jgi:carbon-monoxide dehydrogenase large subunit